MESLIESILSIPEAISGGFSPPGSIFNQPMAGLFAPDHPRIDHNVFYDAFGFSSLIPFLAELFKEPEA